MSQFSNSSWGSSERFSPAPPPPRRMSTGLIVALCVIGMLVVGGGVLGGGWYAWLQLGKDSAETREIIATDLLTAIDVPKNWRSMPDDHEDASIFAGNLFAENYVLVISEFKSEVPVKTLKEYLGLVTAHARSQMASHFVMHEEFETDYRGLPAFFYRFQGMESGHPIIFIGNVIETEQCFHHVMTWTLAHREARNRPILDTVRMSFRERVPQPTQ